MKRTPAARPPRPPEPHLLAPLARPFVWFCLRLGLPPAFYTLLALPLAVAALIVLWNGRLLLALPLVFAAAGADAVDGAVARAREQTTPAGGYLDSMTDRFVDFVVLLGILIAAGETRSWIAGSIALFGTLTTSAAKWRLLQARPRAATRRGFDRTERYVLILTGLLVAGLLGPPHRETALFVLLIVLGAATMGSVIAIMARAWRILHEADEAGPGPRR